MQEINFDCDIRHAGGEPISLSTVSGEILVVNNEITLIFAHQKSEQAMRSQAKWNLQQTNPQGLAKTLCGGRISLRKDVTYGESER